MSPQDSWKREIEPEVNMAGEYITQLSLQLNKTADATPEQFDEWQDKELNWWADRQLNFVAIASIIQLSALGFMASVMFITNLVLKGG
tara:strand:- start:2272 stop:2535 length:264 start_codon:yes stop_codon:yes gene_type:complete